jgi:hypothetical protein
MWCVQGGLCQLARSHDPRVMHLARPYRPWPICENPPAPPPTHPPFPQQTKGFVLVFVARERREERVGEATVK